MINFPTRSCIPGNAIKGILMPTEKLRMMRSLLLTIFLFPLFSQTVPAATPPAITLTWTAPVTNENGSPLTDLYSGRIPSVYTNVIDTKSLATSYTITGLSKGPWYFAVTAYNSAGMESMKSIEVAQIRPHRRHLKLKLLAIFVLIAAVGIFRWRSSHKRRRSPRGRPHAWK